LDEWEAIRVGERTVILGTDMAARGRKEGRKCSNPAVAPFDKVLPQWMPGKIWRVSNEKRRSGYPLPDDI
jgi:hypothetical protein